MRSTLRHSAAAGLLCLAAVPAQAALLFSEYVEGSSNNKGLEIHNNGSTAVDLAGYSVQLFANGGSSASATISLSGSVPAGSVFVLAHASASFAALANQTSSSLTFNGNDAVALRQGSTVLDVIGQIGLDPGAAGWGTDPANTTDNSIRRRAAITAGDSNGNDAFDPAVEWEGLALDSFDGLGCAGTAACGPVEPPPLTRIYEIQGAAHVSPKLGQNVTTRGIVTALRNSSGRGFYLQDPDGDGDPATSDAVFVFTNTAPTVTVGQEVIVSGTVSEFRPGGASTANLSITQIGSPVITPAGDSFFTAAAVSPALLGAGGRAIPTQVIDDDTSGSVENAAQTTYDPASDGIDFYESLEGMLIEVRNAAATGPRNGFGEVWVVADGGADATGVNARGGISLVEREAGIDYNPERIQFDDVLAGSMPVVNVGDTAASLVGVVSYDFGNFEVLPAAVPVFTDNGLLRETAQLPTGADRLTIANYNVENLDPNDLDEDNDTSGVCNDTDVADGKFEAIAAQIVDHLGSPDILALQEVQDENGCTDDGVTSSAGTLSLLVQAVAAAGGPEYAAVDIAPQDGADGGQPGGNIRVAYLYNAARVSLVPGTVGAGDADDATAPATDAEGKLALTLSPGRVQPSDIAWEASRKPLAAVFEFNGHRIVAVNNHWTSKGGGTPLYGRTQPAVNGGQDQRELQAQAVNDFVDAVLAVDGQAKVVVLGDLNEFSFLPPLQIVKGEEPVLVDLVDAQLPAEERYSYSFEGNAQALDHLLVSNVLAQPAVEAQVDIVHVNSEFADQISDHDPDIASFLLPPRVCTNGPGQLVLRTEVYRVIEDAGAVEIGVSREGGACGAAAVSYVSVDGTAKAGQDYVGAFGSLRWGDGEQGIKRFTVQLLDDAQREAQERFHLVFGAASGAAAPRLPNLPVTILDDDASRSSR